MWIALEGIDGCGKTALIDEVRKYVAVTPFHRREFEVDSPYVAAVREHLSAIMWGVGDSRDLSPKFWLYIQAAWHSLARESRDLPSLAISDGWYYKFVARLVGDGYDALSLLQALQFAPRPDRVVLLRVSPEVAWSRKSYRPTELGLHSPVQQGSGRDAFLSYQNRTQQALDSLAAAEGWSVLNVPDSEPLLETAQRLAVMIGEELSAPSTRVDV
jgi:thymidylate kinase